MEREKRSLVSKLEDAEQEVNELRQELNRAENSLATEKEKLFTNTTAQHTTDKEKVT